MAKRTYQQKAEIIAKRIDKSVNDTTFIAFAVDMLVLTLQEIIAAVPEALWLREETTITTTASQQYVNLPADIDVDSIVSLRDETSDRILTRIKPQDADNIDPGRNLDGEPILYWFQRVSGVDRIYFLNQPDDAYTLKMISGEPITDPTSGQTSALPAKYESIEIDGAISKMYPRIPDLDYKTFRTLFERKLQSVIVRDAIKTPGEREHIYGHRPGMAGSNFAPRFPSNFDVTP